MTEQNEIDNYCRNCISRDFVSGRGLVCKRTNAIPTFEGECEYFQKDEERARMAPPPNSEDYTVVSREQLLAQENLPRGVLFGVLACLAGAVIWALISISTGYQIGYMAIGVGFLVGLAMRQGKGIRPIFGIIGAALALLSCVLGDFFSMIGIIAEENEISLMELLVRVDYNQLMLVLTKKSGFHDCCLLWDSRLRGL